MEEQLRNPSTSLGERIESAKRRAHQVRVKIQQDLVRRHVLFSLFTEKPSIYSIAKIENEWLSCLFSASPGGNAVRMCHKLRHSRRRFVSLYLLPIWLNIRLDTHYKSETNSLWFNKSRVLVGAGNPWKHFNVNVISGFEKCSIWLI